MVKGKRQKAKVKNSRNRNNYQKLEYRNQKPQISFIPSLTLDLRRKSIIVRRISFCFLGTDFLKGRGLRAEVNLKKVD